MMNKVLLRRPSPLPNESLTSYTLRLANANQCKPGWLLELFGKPHLRLENLNYQDEDKFIHAISIATMLPEQIIIGMTIVALKNYPRTSSIKFCPYCLNDSIYERIYWLSNRIHICIKHKSYLVSTCPRCQSEVNSVNIASGRCACGFDLTKIIPPACTNKDILDNQKRVYQALAIMPGEDYYKDFPYLSTENYLTFYDFIKEILKNDDLEIILKRILEIDYCFDSKDIVVIIIEQLTKHWPGKFISFLNELDKCQKFFYIKEDFRPKGYLSSHSIIPRSSLSFVNEVLFNYLKSNFTSDFFRTRLNQLLIDEHQIDITVASNILMLPNGGPRILELNEFSISPDKVVDILYTFIKQGKMFNNEQGYSSLIEIIEAFENLNDTILYDIIDLVINKKLDVKLSMPFEGLGQVLVPTLKTKNLLLRLALDRVIAEENSIYTAQ